MPGIDGIDRAFCDVDTDHVVAAAGNRRRHAGPELTKADDGKLPAHIGLCLTVGQLLTSSMARTARIEPAYFLRHSMVVSVHNTWRERTFLVIANRVPHDRATGSSGAVEHHG